MSESHANRDQLLEIEARIQKRHEETKTYEREVDLEREPYLVTFPYPYVNGTLHLGHVLTILTAEVCARYQTSKGKNVLFPFGFHGTGMPIVTCAQRLTNELKEYEDPSTAPKGTQIRTMLEMEIPVDELVKFQDPRFWLHYFMEVGIPDLKRLGVAVDFRRSFTTTDENPRYDSFIKWQFEKIKKYVTFGKRNIIFSRKDGQPCADHDRSIGEGEEPKEYSLILLEWVSGSEELTELFTSLSGPIYLAAATLRPDTMFGQTNVWVQPMALYHLGVVNGKLMVAQPWTFTNLEHQDFSVTMLKETVTGEQLLGSLVQAPLTLCGLRTDRYLASQGIVPVLPLKQVEPEVGTGIVTSVPSNSPTDYLGLKHFLGKKQTDPRLQQVQEFFRSHGRLTIPMLPFITVEGEHYVAMKRCEEQKLHIGDKVKLAEIHHRVYSDEFHNGRFYTSVLPQSVADTASESEMTIPEAQEWTRRLLSKAGRFMPYFEPSGMVISRSGDRCIVAKTDQWFINYKAPEIKEKAVKYLREQLRLYAPETVAQFEERCAWLGEWPCSRHYGLGTQLYETDFKIDSLSDSTIYMAYYTIAHLIEKIPVEKLTLAFWDYVFKKETPMPEGLTEEETVLIKQMRTEFQYWYPVSLRVSAIDLIGNHLIMALHNHIMVWPDEPEKWPQGYAINGYAMLNGQKMSKGKGNFLTLREVVRKYGADPTRFAMVESGEGIHDANFTEKSADNMVMRLTRERIWCTELLQELPKMPKKEQTIWEEILLHQTWLLVKSAQENFENIQLRRVISETIYPMLQIRDHYREMIKAGLITPCPETLRQFTEYLLLVMAPIAPHWAEDLWEKAETVGVPLSREWQMVTPEMGDLKYQWVFEMLKVNTNSVRSRIHKLTKGKKKNKNKNSTEEKETANAPVRAHLKMIASLSDEELEIMAQVEREAIRRDVLTHPSGWRDLITDLLATVEDKKKKGLTGRFVKYCQRQIQSYGLAWCDYIRKPEFLLSVSQQWLPRLLKELEVEIEIIPMPETEKYKSWVGQITTELIA